MRNTTWKMRLIALAIMALLIAAVSAPASAQLFIGGGGGTLSFETGDIEDSNVQQQGFNNSNETNVDQETGPFSFGGNEADVESRTFQSNTGAQAADDSDADVDQDFDVDFD